MHSPAINRNAGQCFQPASCPPDVTGSKKPRNRTPSERSGWEPRTRARAASTLVCATLAAVAALQAGPPLATSAQYRAVEGQVLGECAPAYHLAPCPVGPRTSNTNTGTLIPSPPSAATAATLLSLADGTMCVLSQVALCRMDVTFWAAYLLRSGSGPDVAPRPDPHHPDVSL